MVRQDEWLYRTKVSQVVTVHKFPFTVSRWVFVGGQASESLKQRPCWSLGEMPELLLGDQALGNILLDLAHKYLTGGAAQSTGISGP